MAETESAGAIDPAVIAQIITELITMISSCINPTPATLRGGGLLGQARVVLCVRRGIRKSGDGHDVNSYTRAVLKARDEASDDDLQSLIDEAKSAA